MHRDEEDTESVFPGLGESIRLLVALLVVDLGVHLVLATTGAPEWAGKVATLLAGTVVSNIIVLGAFLRRRGLSLRRVLHPSRVSPSAVLGLLAVPVLLISPALFLASCALDDLVQVFFPLSEQQRQWFEEVMRGGPASLLLLVVVAPFAEELLFRGIVLRGLLARMTPARALVVSSLLFGAAHLNVYQFFNAAAVGLLLGWLYIRFRSTLPGMLLHASGNGLTYLAVSIAPADMPSWEIPAWIWMISALALFPGVALLRRLARHG